MDVQPIVMSTRINVKQTGQELVIPLAGRAVQLQVTPSQSHFNFGAIKVNERGDLMLSLKNENTELPADFCFDRVANFQVSPSKGRLLPLQAADIYVTFMPMQLGKHRGTFNLKLHGGLRTLQIHVMGHAPGIGRKQKRVGGIDKTPEDFKPTLNFVELDENARRPTLRPPSVACHPQFP